MKEDPIRETFPQLLSKAFALGYKAYIPGEGELAEAMMGALYQLMYWLHREYNIYVVVKPDGYGPDKQFYWGYIYCVFPGTSHPITRTAVSEQHFDDWETAHVEGLKLALEAVHYIIKAKNDDNRSAHTGE